MSSTPFLDLILRQIYAIFFALDLLISALTFGAPLETISARLARARSRHSWLGTIMANMVDAIALHVFGTHHHCAAALRAYIEREAVASSWRG